MAVASTSITIKRKIEDILVDPDTLRPIEDAKKPKIDLNAKRNRDCLGAIVAMHGKILNLAFPKPVPAKDKMEVDGEVASCIEEARNSITVGNHIVSIIFTIHNVMRQKVKKTETNMIKKTEVTSCKINFKGQ